MHGYRAAGFALVAVLSTLAVFSLMASAAPNGLAWDSVTKVATNADPSTLQPSSFDADYAAAAAAPQSGGATDRVKQGIAERHYAAGAKERTDNVAQQTATIVDCAARTITTLDLRAKTYRVVSMDQSASPSPGAAGGPLSRFLGNGTRITISVKNTALGPLVVGGQPSNGFRSDMTFTIATASGGSFAQNGVRVAYYSTYANPMSPCSALALAAGQGPKVMAIYEQVMSALSSGGTNLNFSINQSGPTLPIGKLAIYETMTFQMLGHGMTRVTERGNVRPIAADDPVFSIPPGFTKQ